MTDAAPFSVPLADERDVTYYGLPSVKPSLWGGLVSGYMFIAGVGGAAQIIATAADLVGDRALTPIGNDIHHQPRTPQLSADEVLSPFRFSFLGSQAPTFDLEIPTLVLVGADDKPFLAGTDYMASRIPGATKVVLEGAGHASNIDQPEAFNAAVLDFLD